jgi:hypothetical protein
LQNPDEVRKRALSYTYFNNQLEDSTFPGKRTKLLNEIDSEYNSAICGKLTTFLFNLEKSTYCVDIKSAFQIVDSNSVRGWVHVDGFTSDIAAVLYLTPNPPKNSGTEFYVRKENIQIDTYYEHQKQFVMGKTTKEQIIEPLKEHNDQYELADVISNKYNRLVIYPSNWSHCAGSYFGDTNENSRLTQVFFIKCLSHNSDIKYFIDKVRYS